MATLAFATGTWLVNYLLPWLVTFVILGVVLELLDRYVGVKIYRWYYNRGQEPQDRLPPGVEVGFFYNQELPRQHNRALAISAIQSALTVWAGHYTPWELVGEIIALVLEGWFLLPGLWLGNKIYAALQRQEEILHGIQQKGQATRDTATWITSTLSSLWSSIRPARASAPAQPVPPPTTTAPPAPQTRPEGMSAADVLRRHRRQ